MTEHQNHELQPEVPSAAISDSVMAEHMAHAAHGPYTELHNGGRDLTVNQMVGLGVAAGAAMEGARRDYLEKSLGTQAVEPAAQTSEEASLLLASAADPRSYPETKKNLYEENISQLKSTVSGIFDTIRTHERAYPGFEHTERQTDKGEVVMDKVFMYHPESRIVTKVIQETLYPRSGGREVLNTIVHETGFPVNGTETKFSGMLYAQRHKLRIDSSSGEDDTTLYHTRDLQTDKDPKVVGDLLLSLAESFPLSEPRLIADDSKNDLSSELAKINVNYPGVLTVPRYRRLTKDLQRKLDADQQRYNRLKEPVDAEATDQHITG